MLTAKAGRKGRAGRAFQVAAAAFESQFFSIPAGTPRGSDLGPLHSSSLIKGRQHVEGHTRRVGKMRTTTCQLSSHLKDVTQCTWYVNTFPPPLFITPYLNLIVYASMGKVTTVISNPLKMHYMQDHEVSSYKSNEVFLKNLMILKISEFLICKIENAILKPFCKINKGKYFSIILNKSVCKYFLLKPFPNMTWRWYLSF